jgi:hypothetical protein
MARRVYFAFHYQRDIWRVNLVRSWVTHSVEQAGFYDNSLWEEAKKKDDAAIKRMIDKGIKRSSVTVVLIGTETAGRAYVKYEISQSHDLGKGLLGIHIHSIMDTRGHTDIKGPNPFDQFFFEQDGRTVCFSQVYKTYNWVLNDGWNNFGSWVKQAATDAGKLIRDGRAVELSRHGP